MKNKKIFLVVIIFLLISMIIILNKNIIIKNKKEVVKEMSESTQVSDLQTQINTLNASHDEYAKNVQAYKEKIAEAITNQGVSTSASNTAEVMAENIGKILQAKTTATATAAQILKGQTAWVNGNKVTGTMVDRGAVTKTLNAGGSYTIPAGYHNGSGKVTANSLASQTQATATADNITKGKTAYVNGKLITGNGTDNNSYYSQGISNALKYPDSPGNLMGATVSGGSGQYSISYLKLYLGKKYTSLNFKITGPNPCWAYGNIEVRTSLFGTSQASGIIDVTGQEWITLATGILHGQTLAIERSINILSLI